MLVISRIVQMRVLKMQMSQQEAREKEKNRVTPKPRRRRLTQQYSMRNLLAQLQTMSTPTSPAHRPKPPLRKATSMPPSRNRSRSSPAKLKTDPFESRFALFDPNTRVHVRFPLTRGQLKALRFTWSRLQRFSATSGQGLVSQMERVFETVFSIEPKLKTIYLSAVFLSRHNVPTIRDHAHLICKWIDKVLSCIKPVEDGKRCEADIYIPGAPKHAAMRGLGMSVYHWEVFGESLSDVIYKQDSVRAYPGAAKAWLLCLSVLTDQLRCAFEHPPRSHAVDV